MIRRNRAQRIEDALTTLDVFPKTEPDVQETSTSGGAVSIIMALLITSLVGGEFMYYRTLDIKYEFKVDTEMVKVMYLTLDLTINMKCDYLGADYIDVAGNSTDVMSKYLQMEAAHFELAPNQAKWDAQVQADKEVEGARGFDSLQRFLHSAERPPMPDAEPPNTEEGTACRMRGTMPINKVAGNFHITAGKSIHHARGHSHLVGMVPQNAMNFSHRINRLSFSEFPGTQTLDGDTLITENGQEMFQYYLKIVATHTKNIRQKEPLKSSQYSVHESHRTIEFLGMGGLPGIYVKFDLEPLCVHVKEVRRSLTDFLVRLCGIVGGIFATTGMLHQTIQGAVGTFTSAGGASNLPRSSTDTAQ